ncbi:hypothetical protein RN629_10435 [Sphingomonadaceae bacterium jetA1]|jgi:hypothetical protein|uniref:hypothetical protein n=1 Tax=Facivitalis istanbulensis TaxID=3075838 RepID=UPI00347BD73C
MRNLVLKLAVLTVPLATGGCVKTVTGVVKAPFQAAGQVVDWTTTSQDEADRNYGRKMRKREAREGRERAAYEKQCRRHPEECQPGSAPYGSAQAGQGQPQGYDGYRAGNE